MIFDRFLNKNKITESDGNTNNKFLVAKRSEKEGVGVDSRAFTFSKIDDLPQNTDLQELYLRAYKQFGIVAKIVDATVEQTVQSFYFKGKNEKTLEKLRKKLNLDIHFQRVCKTMLKNGNCWVEIVEDKGDITKLKLLPPEQMVVVKTRKGKIIAYVQQTGDKNLVWGKIVKTNSFFSDGGNNVEVGKLENVIHYIFNKQAGEKYGTALIRPAIDMLKIKARIISMLPDIILRYLSPIIHVSVGDENAEPDQTQIDKIKGDMKDIYTDTEYVTDYRIKMTVLGFANSGVIPVDTIMKVIDDDIMMAMGMFPVLTKGGQEDKGGEVQLRAEGRHIKAIQRELKTEFEDKFIIATGIGDESDELIWEIIDERELVEHIANVTLLAKAGLITPQFANSLLPRMFHEKLPILPLVPQNDMDGTDGEKTITNPTDPTQSSKMVDGQRIKKDEHRNPLDKNVKKTDKSQHEVTKK